MESKTGHLTKPIHTMFIADEAHTLGAKEFLANKPNFLSGALPSQPLQNVSMIPMVQKRYSISLGHLSMSLDWTALLVSA